LMPTSSQASPWPALWCSKVPSGGGWPGARSGPPAGGRAVP
jgi:hypothetical protein